MTFFPSYVVFFAYKVYLYIENRKTMDRRKTIFLKNIVNGEPFIRILRKEWEKAGEGFDENTIIRDRIWKGIHKNIHKKGVRKSRYYLVKATSIVAASVLLYFFAGNVFLTGKIDTDAEEIYQKKTCLITAEESKTCVLPDGTKVWMEVGSELRLPGNFIENRELWLKGNSTFEVAGQEGNSFKVHLTRSYVEVKGTSFFINQDAPEANIIALYSGRVNLVFEASGQTMELHPSQRIVYNSIEAAAQVEPMYENIQWADGNYKLLQTNLPDLVNFLAWKYNIRIEMEKLPLKKLKVTGNIHYDESLESVLNKVSYSLKLKYRQVDKRYILYRDVLSLNY